MKCLSQLRAQKLFSQQLHDVTSGISTDMEWSLGVSCNNDGVWCDFREFVNPEKAARICGWTDLWIRRKNYERNINCARKNMEYGWYNVHCNTDTPFKTIMVQAHLQRLFRWSCGFKYTGEFYTMTCYDLYTDDLTISANTSVLSYAICMSVCCKKGRTTVYI